MKFSAVEVAPELNIPAGSGICPVCNGTKHQELSPKDKACSWNRGKTHRDCQNCGGQMMFGVSKGYTKINPATGSGCLHIFASKNVGRCLTKYTCTHCELSYVIDSGD